MIELVAVSFLFSISLVPFQSLISKCSYLYIKMKDDFKQRGSFSRYKRKECHTLSLLIFFLILLIQQTLGFQCFKGYMNLQGGSLNMDDEEETTYSAIDIVDWNKVDNGFQYKYGNSYSPRPNISQSSYFGSEGSQSFYLDDINVVGCGYSNHTKYVREIQNTSTTPIISMFEGELLNLKWSRQYFMRDPNSPNSMMSNVAQCIFSPSGKMVIAQFTDEFVQNQTQRRGIPLIAVIRTFTGEIIKSYLPISVSQTAGLQNLKMNFGSDFQLKMTQETRLLAIFRLQQQFSTVIIADFDPLNVQMQTPLIGQRMIAYYTMSVGNMQAVDLKTFAVELSENRQQIYFGGSISNFSTIYRWNVDVKKVEWQYILAEKVNAFDLSQSSIEVQKISHRVNTTKDEGHIIYCSHVLNWSNEKRTQIGYLVEKQYSKGGSVGGPLISKLLYLDPEARGACQDVFLDLKLRQASVFISSRQVSTATPGSSYILTIPLNISSNITLKPLTIGTRNIPQTYMLDIMSDFAIKLTGINRAYFGGKTLQWDGFKAKIGLIASFPTSQLLQSDPISDGFFIHYNPDQFEQFSSLSFTLDQKPFEYKFVQPSNQQSSDCFLIDATPKVSIPNIRITYSMEGDTNFKYTVTRPALLIGLRFYVSGTCNDVPLDYIVQVVPDTHVKPFVTYDGLQVKVYTNAQSMSGLYQVKITARTPNFVNRTAEFQLSINEIPIPQIVSSAKKAPYFVSELPIFLNVSFECTKIYQLPKIMNPNPLVLAQISFKSQNKDGLPNFILFQNGKLIITPTATVEIALHQIEIILKNDDNQTSKYVIYVYVLPKNNSLYDSRIIIDTSQRKDYDVQAKRENYPTVSQMRINNKGEVILKFEYPINGHPMFKLTEENFHFQIEPTQHIRWEIKEVSPDQKLMTLQIIFEKPDGVSMSSLNRAKLKMFFKPSIGYSLKPNSRFLQTASQAFLFFQNDAEVPVQLSDQKITKFFDSVSDAFKSIATSILATNLSFTLLLSCSMQLLWSFVNSLQLISLIPLMNVVIPSNLYYVCSLIAGPLSLKLFDVSNFTSRLFRLETEYQPYSPHFEAFGFQNTQVILDLQISLYIILATPGTFLILFIFNKCTIKCQKAHNFAQKMSRMMQYSFYVRMLIEEFVSIFITCLINVMRPKYKTWGEILSYSLAIILIILPLSLPIILTLYILSKKQTEEKRQKLGEKLGSIYKDMRKDTPMRLLFAAFYVVRRLIFVISVLFLASCPMIQIFLFHLTSVIQFIYVGLWRPFEDPKQNNLELLNEGCVLLISTLLPAFTDYLEDDTGHTQKVLGWVVLSLIFAQCAFNIGVQVKDQWLKVRIGWTRIKRCRQRGQSVKMMSETQLHMDLVRMAEQEEPQELKSKKQKRKEFEKTDLYATGKDWKGNTRQIEMMPIAEVPNHEESFISRGGAGCLNLDSLQLFTPRGMHLFGPPQLYQEPQNPDELRVQEIIEEELKEEEDVPNYNPKRNFIYQDSQSQLDRASTAQNNQQRQRRDGNRNKLQRVSTIGQDEFLSQFSIMPVDTNKPLESSRIRVVPSAGVSRQVTLKGTMETESEHPSSLTTTLYNVNHTVSEKNNHFTSIDPQNMSSTMPTTMPYQNESPSRPKTDKQSSSSGGTNSHLDTSSDNIRLKSSDGISQKSGESTVKPRPKKPNSRIKIYN